MPNSATPSCVVVVPVYRQGLTADEETSLRHLDAYLPAAEKVLVQPAGLGVKRVGYRVEEFPAEYFRGVAGYCRLCQSRAFYERFAAFDYLLIHQTDALLLSGDLAPFLASGWDYIGAPFVIPDAAGNPAYGGVGNGGLSLRRVPAFLRLLEKTGDVPNAQYPADYLEDCWFAQHAPDLDPAFRFADFATALAFSWELFPRGLEQLSGGRLPFGAHAWGRYDRAFWRPYLIPPGGRPAVRTGPSTPPAPLPGSRFAADLASFRASVTDSRIKWPARPVYRKPDPPWITLVAPGAYLAVPPPPPPPPPPPRQPAPLELTQFLIFEVPGECNLGEKHPWCPHAHPARFANSTGRRPLTDDQIAAMARAAYTDLGFRGLVGWHYYNEPLLAWDRLKPLMARIRSETPAARFVLWTNGQALPADRAELAAFDTVNITQYPPVADTGPISRAVRILHLRPVTPDARLNPVKRDSPATCRRMFVELIIDHYGEVHICCQDWRRECAVGNVHDTPLAEIVARWNAIRATMTGPAMLPASPAVCRTCTMRCPRVPAQVPEIAQAAEAWLAGRPLPPAPPPAARIAPAQAVAAPGRSVNRAQAGMPAPAPLGPAPYLTVGAYRMPAHRVADFCRWNDAVFRAAGVRVVLVVEADYPGLPEYVMQLRFTAPLPVYSPARVRNAGISVCLACGGDPVITADVDIEIPAPALAAMLAVRPGQCSMPMYRMAASFEARHTHFVPAPYATGAVSMRAADWRRPLHYDERCEGYGVEDGLFVQDLKLAGVQIVDRDQPVYHVAHAPGTCQVEFRGRADHWNRASGFNPENFRANERFKRY